MEDLLVPYDSSTEVPEGRVLVLAPHPDDEVFGCGGAILRHVAAGHVVRVVIVTDGGFRQGKDNERADYVRMRRRESQSAARILGYGQPLFWDLPDRGVQYGERLIERIRSLLEEEGVDIVYAPSPVEMHPDHRALGAACVEAVRRAPSQRVLSLYEVGVPLTPNRLLDITDLAERKREAMQCFASQLSLQPYDEHIAGLNRFRTYTLPAHVRAAEAFQVVTAAELRRSGLDLFEAEWRRQQRLGLRAESGQPLVSVVIRSLGRDGLDEALDSVALQTHPRIEVVLVNAKGEGHPDLGQWCGRFSLRVCPATEPLGRGAAANLGLGEARGDYVVLLDDDDWFLADHVASLVEALSESTDVRVAYAGVRAVARAPDGSWEDVQEFNDPYDAVRLLFENYIPVHAALFERSLVTAGCRFDESLERYEDWDFWLQCAAHSAFRHVDRISAIYRISSQSGFGVRTDAASEDAMQRFFAKWRDLWSDGQLRSIVEYAKYKRLYGEQLRRAEEDRALIDERTQWSRSLEAERADLRESLVRVRAELEAELKAERERAAEERAALGETLEAERKAQAEELSRLQQALEREGEQRARAGAYIEELMHSTSWRVTAPLRWLSIRARRAARQLGRRSRQLAQQYERAHDIWRTQGAEALLRRVQDKLARVRGEELPRMPESLEVPAAWTPLAFAPADEPLVSIVIPVHGKHLHTFACLKSILEKSGDVPYEVVVVDDRSSDETPQMLGAMSGIRVVRNSENGGFIGACNRGAQEARGTYLVFLNNDTVVTPGWLGALCETAQGHEKVGLVGAKLVYPDARLQEAGGIVWRDGSAWNYGRYDDPNKPEYSYLREADYCSGACLLAPRELFLELGMFDAHFAPAYYEDADLAFRVRSAGYRVYYQPLCRIVHFEGVSSGTSTDEGMKRFQLVNQKKFAERWRQTLQEHAPNGQTPELERERTVGKRALVLDACMLTPDRDSGSLRMFNLLRVLQSLGYKVTFCAENLQYLEEYTPPLQKLGIEVPYTPYVTSVEQYLEEHRQLYDVVLLSRADVAERFVDVVRRCASPATQVVFDTVDLHYLRELRLAEMNGGSAALRKAQRRKEQELGIAAKADVTLVVSPAEKRLLQEESSRMRVEVVSNIHEVHGCRRAFWERRDLLFVGGFQHPPNEDAVIYFVEQVFPKVLARLRGLNFHIVGSNPPARVRALASEHVHVAGFVPDLEPLLDSCRMTVAPLRYGAGVKGKVNTSMSYGVPVVATTTATEGMQLRDGVDVLIADDPQTFADAVVRLYGNEVLWNQLSNNGMANIERYFSFEAARQAMERALSPASVAGRVRHRPVRAGLSVGI